jgi:hypothetical protein
LLLKSVRMIFEKTHNEYKTYIELPTSKWSR